MGDPYRTLKVRQSVLDKLENAKQILQKEEEFEGLKLTYSYIINRMYERWIKL